MSMVSARCCSRNYRVCYFVKGRIRSRHRHQVMSKNSNRNQRKHARRTMLGWIALECWEVREKAGISRSTVAAAADGADQSSIYYFEIADRWPTKIGPDRLVAIYAELCGADPRGMWVRAATRFRKHGAPPLAHPEQEPDLLAEAEAEAGALDQQLAERTSQPPEEDSEQQANRRRQRRRPA